MIRNNFINWIVYDFFFTFVGRVAFLFSMVTCFFFGVPYSARAALSSFSKLNPRNSCRSFNSRSWISIFSAACSLADFFTVEPTQQFRSQAEAHFQLNFKPQRKHFSISKRIRNKRTIISITNQQKHRNNSSDPQCSAVWLVEVFHVCVSVPWNLRWRRALLLEVLNDSSKVLTQYSLCSQRISGAFAFDSHMRSEWVEEKNENSSVAVRQKLASDSMLEETFWMLGT